MLELHAIVLSCADWSRLGEGSLLLALRLFESYNQWVDLGGETVVNLKKLFQLAMSKQDEAWNHSIIKTKADLKTWLDYERNQYAAELSPGGYT